MNNKDIKKYGMKIKLPKEIEGRLYFSVHKNDILVAHAKVTVEKQEASIADIYVYNYRKKKISLYNCIFKFYLFKNYRNKGIGTFLLEKIIIFCKNNGITRLTGKMAGDIKILRPWYESHGFRVNVDNSLEMLL